MPMSLSSANQESFQLNPGDVWFCKAIALHKKRDRGAQK